MSRDRVLQCYSFLHAWLLAAVLELFLLSLPSDCGWSDLGKGLYFFLPVCVLSYVSDRGKRIWSYLFCAAVFLYGGWLLGSGIWEKVVFVGVTGILALSYFADRIRYVYGFLTRPAYPFLLFFAAVYFYALYFKRNTLESVCLWTAALYWLLNLWNKSREELLRVWQENCGLYRFPKYAIAGNNRLLLLLLSLVTIGGMFLLPLTGLRQGIYSLGRALRAVLVWVLGRFGGGEDTGEELQEAEAVQGGIPQAEPGESPEFLVWLFGILEKLVIVAVVLAAAAGVVYLLYYLWRRYSEGGSENGDVLEFIGTKRTERREHLTARRKRQSFFLRAGTDEKIRKYYRRQILKYTSGTPNKVETPEELEQNAGMKDSPDREQLHRIYEKARYGREPCTREEEQEMKHLDRVDFS